MFTRSLLAHGSMVLKSGGAVRLPGVSLAATDGLITRDRYATTMPTTKDEIEEENEIENVYTNEYYTRMSPSSCDWSEENIIAVGCKAGRFVLLIVRFIVSLILIPFLLLRYRRRRRRHRHHHHHNAHFCLFLLH